MAEKLEWEFDGYGSSACPWLGLVYYAMPDGAWFRHDGPVVNSGETLKDAKDAAERDFADRHSTWREIATAPRDRKILVYEPSPAGPWMEVTRWHGSWGHLAPTHWCELPPEPLPGGIQAFERRVEKAFPRAALEPRDER